METASASSSAPRLRRTLTLWDLILYGVIVIQPVAPMSVFGVLSDRGRGHVVTTLLIAMVAMLFTAFSYGRMARAYPSAGSAFTYVGQEINPAVGYITGWSMVMDYMLNPMICIIWCSQQAHVFAPGVPYAVWAIFFASGVHRPEYSGHKDFGAGEHVCWQRAWEPWLRFSSLLRPVTSFALPTMARRFLLRPFYDPSMWDMKAVLGATSIAVLSYIGFDGISTLSEEAENPRRNILLATVLDLLCDWNFSAFEVYAAQLIWPQRQPFPNSDTAFTFVAGRAWAPLFAIVGFTLLVANFGSGHGRANRSGAVALRNGTQQSSAPIILRRSRRRNDMCRVTTLFLSGVVALAGAVHSISYGLGAEMLNFGASDRLHGRQFGRFCPLSRSRGRRHSADAPSADNRCRDRAGAVALSKLGVIGSSGRRVGNFGGMDATAGRFRDLLFSVEES